ncbi:uncharacterized protein LOC132454187 [Gadus macrocephalus]|uniref:uncharacterized protein LOC132454187 n=1 Tax=Gadus macrocephalus TaxID=80720 RepID=UPI0028CB1CB4|nr:uncharacterized protein LOC132454187 [Gadus macrocephalus]
MRCSLQAVSNPDSDLPMASFDGYVDLPLRLAMLHGLLHPLLARGYLYPHRRPGPNRYALKRQTSTEDLQIDSPEQEHEPGAAHPLDISSPQTGVSLKPTPKPVPWIKQNHKKEHCEIQKSEYEQLDSLDRKHAEELSELRLGVEQVTERELEMAKRLEDFIAQSMEQNEMLQAEVHGLRNTVESCEEQLASATFRLGMIEEEREEDERKLNVALAAAERVNVLEEQLADMLKGLHRLNKEVCTENDELPPRESHVHSD